jgi:DNA-nicking Smr family endonuclease
LRQAQEALTSGKIQPNMNDGKNHIFLIICGAGNHSANGAVLKKQIQMYLQ